MRKLRYLIAAGAAALAMVAGFEGFSSASYQDEAGVWTNGHGTTQGVTKDTPPVTRAEAAEALKVDMAKFQERIDACFTRPVGPNASGAFSSLAYNIGPGAFCGSSAVRHWNAGRFAEACNAILLWNKIRIRGVLTYSRGLANRRAQEAALCRLDI